MLKNINSKFFFLTFINRLKTTATTYKWTSFHSVCPSLSKERKKDQLLYSTKLLKINCDVENDTTGKPKKLLLLLALGKKPVAYFYQKKKTKQNKEKGKTSQFSG